MIDFVPKKIRDALASRGIICPETSTPEEVGKLMDRAFQCCPVFKKQPKREFGKRR